jgi:hypothetical protein
MFRIEFVKYAADNSSRKPVGVFRVAVILNGPNAHGRQGAVNKIPVVADRRTIRENLCVEVECLFYGGLDAAFIVYRT